MKWIERTKKGTYGIIGHHRKPTPHSPKKNLSKLFWTALVIVMVGLLILSLRIG